MFTQLNSHVISDFDLQKLIATNLELYGNTFYITNL